MSWQCHYLVFSKLLKVLFYIYMAYRFYNRVFRRKKRADTRNVDEDIQSMLMNEQGGKEERK